MQGCERSMEGRASVAAIVKGCADCGIVEYVVSWTRLFQAARNDVSAVYDWQEFDTIKFGMSNRMHNLFGSAAGVQASRPSQRDRYRAVPSLTVGVRCWWLRLELVHRT